MKRLLIVILISLPFFFSGGSQAGYFHWIDENGIHNFSNHPRTPEGKKPPGVTFTGDSKKTKQHLIKKNRDNPLFLQLNRETDKTDLNFFIKKVYKENYKGLEIVIDNGKKDYDPPAAIHSNQVINGILEDLKEPEPEKE